MHICVEFLDLPTGRPAENRLEMQTNPLKAERTYQPKIEEGGAIRPLIIFLSGPAFEEMAWQYSEGISWETGIVLHRDT